MKVKELIEELQKHDPELLVCGAEYDYIDFSQDVNELSIVEIKKGLYSTKDGESGDGTYLLID